MLSLNTDFDSASDPPGPALRQIAQAGFPAVHWCHHWYTDHLYGAAEMAAIQRELEELGLSVCGVHASEGSGAIWNGTGDDRRAGVALVRNRMELAVRLGAPRIVLHIPPEPASDDRAQAFWDRVRASLDALQVAFEELGVRVALENLPWDNFSTLERSCAAYPPAFLGICYDSGHGLLSGVGPERLAGLRERVIALHLHDNDGTADRHQPPFTGSVDWEGLVERLAPWTGAVTMECHRPEGEEVAPFLNRARRAGQRLADRLREAPAGGGAT